MTGHYHHLIERRDAVLAGARMSPMARARAMGRPLYRWVPAKTAEPEVQQEPRLKKRLGLGSRSTMTARAQQVTAAFCKAFEIDVDKVLSPHRARVVARPRQCILYFLHREMKLSQPEAGRMMQRDHTTVLSSCRMVESLLGSDPDFSARYHRAVRAIRALWSE